MQGFVGAAASERFAIRKRRLLACGKVDAGAVKEIVPAAVDGAMTSRMFAVSETAAHIEELKRSTTREIIPPALRIIKLVKAAVRGGNCMRTSMLAVALTAVLVGPVFAGDDSSSEGTKTDNSVNVNTVFGRYGFSSSPHVTASLCNVELTLNQKAFVENIDELKQMHLMNNEISQTMINSKPSFLSMAFAFQLLPVATKEIYDENKDVDRCQFSQSLSSTDDYGNDKKILMLTYEFTRALFKKINWDNFQAQGMMKVAPKFRINPEFGAIVVKEREGAN
jgi:hypothetical protein